jgi:hypothetical protein
VRPRGSGRRAWRRHAASVAACVMLGGGLATACTTARSDLGTSTSSCYLALPTAKEAVEGHGRLLGVQRFSLTALHQQAPTLYSQLDSNAPGSQRVCVVDFGGRFDAASVHVARGRSSGLLAVVVSTTPGNHVLGTVILARPPLRFGHSHAG